MNDHNQPPVDDSPDPKFVEHLEWQLRTEFRRESRLAAQKLPVWRRPGLRAAALATISLLVGFGGATAAQETDERLRRELLEAEGRLQLQLARSELSFAEAQLAEAQSRREAGVASDQEWADAVLQREMLQRELDLMRREVEYQERTGRKPSRGLASPIDGETDFVRARLLLDRDNVQERLTVVAFQVEMLADRVQLGTASETELQHLQNMQENLVHEFEYKNRLLRLRRQFVAGEIDAPTLERRAELESARTDEVFANSELALSRLRLDELAGHPGSNELDLRAAQHQFETAQLRLEMASLRLRLLRRAQ